MSTASMMSILTPVFSKFRFLWAKEPMSGAALLALLLTFIVVPYWWLAVQWSYQIIPLPSLQFTFATTTFLLTLIVIDSLFIIRYYQIVRKNEFIKQTQELRTSEKNYRALLELAPFPIVISRISDSIIRFINQRTAEFFHIDETGAIGKNVRDFYVQPDDRIPVLEELRLNGQINNYEVQLLTSAGLPIWVSLSATMNEYMGEPCLFIAFIDISKRKELEEEIQESEELYRSIVTASPDAIGHSDLHGVITMLSPTGVAMFGGLKTGDLNGHNVLEFIHPEDAPQAQENILNLMSGKKQNIREYRGQRIDGSHFPYEIHSELTHDDTGRPSGIVYVIRDITRRKEAEEIIRENEERFATIFQEVPVPLLILGENSVIIEINAMCEQRFQISQDQIVGMRITDLGLFSSNGDGDPYRFILGHNPGKSLETRLHLPDGTWRYVTIRSRFITLRRSPAILLLIHDIDEIRRAQNALTQAYAQINLLNSITRHDILNRVMVVMSYSEFLHEQVNDPSSLTYISRIQESGRDIQHFIEFTKHYQDLGVKKPEWQCIDLILKSRSFQPLIRDITVHLPVSSYEIYADPMLERVMYNLIENSYRHGQTVTEISIQYGEEDEYLRVWYSDNGVGIPLSEKPMIFKKGHGKNTGLGLFLIREILHITGITITENGIPGEGARFEMQVLAGSFRSVVSS